MEKHKKQSYVARVAIGMMAVLIVMSQISVSAQPTAKFIDKVKNEYALKNLESGIKSDNLGVRRSSIYFAGKYQVKSLVGVLLTRLQTEEDANTRILIGLTLYQIQEKNVIKNIMEISEKEKDVRVKKMLSEICNQISSFSDLTDNYANNQ